MSSFEINFDNFQMSGAGAEIVTDTPVDASDVRAAVAVKSTPYNKMIRLISDKNLEDLLPWHFDKNVAYHCLSYGGVDEWSYIKFILKQEQLDYCLISSWIISPDDAREILDRVKAGDIKRLDVYVGDIFRGGYRGAYDIVSEAVKLTGGRIVTFHNHCKIMLGFGDRFDFAIESSCNLNINLRLEQTTIYTDRELALFYKNYFDQIYSFNRDFDDWSAWDEKDSGRNVSKRQPGDKGSGDHPGRGRAGNAKKNRKADRNI